MIDDAESVAHAIEETIHEAERNGADREQVAEILERLSKAVQEGYTELPEHRGPWWHEVHGDQQEGTDADR